MSNKLLVLIGFSASGKDSIQSELEKFNFKRCVSHTSRPMRISEKEGREYYFVDKKEFLNMDEKESFAGKPRVYNTLVNGTPDIWWYGLSKNEVSDLSTNRVTILDLDGAIAMKDYMGDDMVSVFVEVDEETRKERIMGRGDYDESEWKRRAEDDRRIFENAKECEVIDFWVQNYDINDCVSRILEFMEDVTNG